MWKCLAQTDTPVRLKNLRVRQRQCQASEEVLLLLLLLNTVYFKQHRVYDVELHKVRHTGLKTGILV